MTRDPTDTIQSFRLRFWREPRQGTSAVWRGSVWHEQQSPGDEAVAVADPDEAFALVRSRLYGVSEGRDEREGRKSRSAPFFRYCLAAIWRKLASSRP
jgi:hypothetical protein